jgi:hypothetical protein
MGSALQGQLSGPGGVGAVASQSFNQGILGGIGRLAVPLAAAFGALNIGQFVGDAIGAASDLSETQSAVRTVFGDANDQVAAFADGAARSLGMTQQQALEGARTFGIFGQAAGLQGSELATFSTDLVGLATDFASFNNVEPDAAIEAIGAGLRGESEPLRQFGILLDDATLRARAMEMGIYDGVGALSQQERVMAAQAEIFEQAGVQAGDFERTSDGLANQQRVLQAQWEDFTAQVGTAFLPIMTDLVTMLNDSFMPALEDMIEVFQSEDLQGELQDAFEEIAPLLPDIADAFVELVRESVPLIPTMIELAGALLPLLPPLAEIATEAIPVLVEALDVLMPALQWFADLAGTLGDMPGLMDVFDGVDQSELAGLTQTFSDFFGLFGIDILDMIGDVTTSMLALMDDTLVIFGALGDGLQAVAEGDFGAIPGIIAGAMEDMESNTRSGVDGVKSEFGKLGPGVQAAAKLASAQANEAGKSISANLAAGIKSNQAAAAKAMSQVMASVKAYMPNSPADKGPFSGSGWRAVAGSGEAIVSQFQSGLSGLDDVITSGVQVPRVPVSAEVASYAAAQSGGGATVNVYPSQAMDEYLVGDVVANSVSRVLR